jgi:DNA polymerase-3 subunit alpha (Gram-positive type)
MQKKMLRFLTSLGVSDPERFDLDFEIVGRDPQNHNKVEMTIRKETPWDASTLEEFKSALSGIHYDYTLRFSYALEPSFSSVESLFEGWYLSQYHGVPPFHLALGNNNEILISLADAPSHSSGEGISHDFSGLLQWLSYPFEVKVLEGPLPAPKNQAEETIPKKDETFKSQEKAKKEPAAVKDTKSEGKPQGKMAAPKIANTEDDSDEEGDKEPVESEVLAEGDKNETAIDGDKDSEEATRQEDLRAAEQSFLENIKAAQTVKDNHKAFVRGDYAELPDIEKIFSLPQGNVSFHGEVFEVVTRLTRRGTLMASFGVGAPGSAVNVRAMESKNGMTADVLTGLKVGDQVAIRGAIEFDQRNGERQIFAHYIDKLPAKELRTDSEPEKRVELHLHTKMSAMDGLGDIENYVALAKAMGMKALAVTDHGVIQSFPAAESAGAKAGLKILYGIEFYAFDFPKYVYNPVPVRLNKARYCVFDFETTGLSSRYDHPTEFGGVIVENGLVTKRFDQFINAGVHIPEKITEKTHITDAMIKNAPDEKTAAKIISEFIGDAVLVSHNAPFDVGFLNAMRAQAGMPPIANTVVDTLALSHYLFPEAGRHTLGALSRNLGLAVYNEDEAHRADFDAESLNSVWQTIIPLLEKTTKDLTLEDLGKLICKNSNVYRHLKTFHLVALAKNQAGIKSLYRLVSDSETTFMAAGSTPKIPREELVRERANLLFGSACFNGEVFELAMNKSEQELKDSMGFYDYIEIQPKENYSWLVNMKMLDEERLATILKSIVKTADEVHKPICATGDCHYVNPEDKICRDIYISAKALGGGNHPLNGFGRNKLPLFPNPDQHFRSTREMLDSFRSWLPEEKCQEIVIENTQKIADEIEPCTILKDKLYTPDANLPGSDVKLKEICYTNLHKTYGDHPDPKIVERLDKELNGIVSHGYSVTYYIAHCLIQKANSDGYFVGSRGSVGSSFAANMAGITEVNPLHPHYLCPKCKHFEWGTDPKIRSGFDLPDKRCPECGTEMIRDGQSIPFETFLGFNAEKVPDIDLNFPQDYQSKAHDFTRTLLSTPEENEKIAKGEPISNPHVIRAGTIATAEEKNAFGYVKGYFERTQGEDSWPKVNKAYAAYLAARCTGVKRTTGQHPGGIVVIPANMDIFDFTPYQYPADDPSDGWLTTHYEFASMHDSVLKLDELGHVDPMALRMMSLMTKIGIYDIPMNDPKVLSLFSSPAALGLKSNPLDFKTGAIALPEFGTNFVQGLLEEAKPKTFDDLLIISGLSHGTDVWNNNAEDLIKSGQALGSVIGCRDDIMNYLIQMGVPNSVSFKIMEDVRHGKKLKPDYAKTMKEHNVPEWYLESCNKIHYLFPRAHATAYVMGAVRVAWFKIYHPLEFYATYFSTRCDRFDIKALSGNLDELLGAINALKMKAVSKIDYSDADDEILKSDLAACEMVDRGYKIENINIMESDASLWKPCPARNSIIPPFNVISNFGAKAAQGIVKAREAGPFLSKEDLKDRVRDLKDENGQSFSIGESAIQALDEVGALAGLGDSNQMSLFDFKF